jgi:hypothetical protein
MFGREATSFWEDLVIFVLAVRRPIITVRAPNRSSLAMVIFSSFFEKRCDHQVMTHRQVQWWRSGQDLRQGRKWREDQTQAVLWGWFGRFNYSCFPKLVLQTIGGL